MASSSQNLTTNVVINAQVGAGFGEVGTKLNEIGTQLTLFASMFNEISQGLIDFGVDSIDVYKDYQKYMTEAEGALATIYGRGTAQLSQVMTDLDEAATQWAADTIFHTDDVAHAIDEAAHANWNFEQIMTGMPVAMQLAQAGGIDLSTALDYIIKSSNAAGISFDDMSSFIDHWTFAANSSATTIDEMGEAMVRLGPTMQFAGSTDSVLVMLSALANMGTVGQQAGTMLRNAMIRLVAPTDKAQEAMEGLGIPMEGIAEIWGEYSEVDQDELAGAYALLDQVGFSVYDSAGNLKEMTTVFEDLGTAINMLPTEEEQNKVLSAIFPTRSNAAARSILSAATDDWNGLLEALESGDAEGYASYLQQLMSETLYGQMELFESKVERLKQVVGEELAGDLENVMTGIGSIVDSIAEMDPGTLGALIDGLKVIAGIGPGLMIAGGAFRMASMLFGGGSYAMAFMFGTLALSVGAFVSALDEARFEDRFGELSLDTEEMNTYLYNLGEGFRNAQSNIDQYNQGLDIAVTHFRQSSGALKTDLVSAMLTNKELSDDDKAQLREYGENISNAMTEGIVNNYAAMQESLINAFQFGSTGGEDAEDNAVMNQIMSILDLGFQNDIDRAAELSQQLRDAMTSAFSDGHLTAEEVSNIQSILDEQTKLIAQQQDKENYLEREKTLRKAQTLGLDSTREISEMAEERRDAEWNTLRDQQASLWYDTKYWYEQAIERGWMVSDYDENGEKIGEHVATDTDLQTALATLTEKQANEEYSFGADYTKFIGDLWTELISSNMPDAWNTLQNVANQFRAAGGHMGPALADEFNNALNGTDMSDLSRAVNEMVEAMGGVEKIDEYASYFDELGDVDTANWYRTIRDMSNVFANMANIANVEAGTNGVGTYDSTDLSALLAGYADSSGSAYSVSDLSNLMYREAQMAADNGVSVNWTDFWTQTFASQSGLYEQALDAAMQAGFESLEAWVQNIEASSAKRMHRNNISAEEAESRFDENGYTTEVEVKADTTNLTEAITDADGQTLTEILDGDDTELRVKIYDLDNKTLTEYVTGNAAQLDAIIHSYDNRTIRLNIVPVQSGQGYAEGGRAVTASIFGEAGPEWAIPEEHTQRTAELLNAARQASGFSWGELLSMYGGMNANPNNSPTTLVYSPVINAQNADGVDKALMADKDRLYKWLQDQKMMDRMEVYA